jgi:hypothetical protein
MSTGVPIFLLCCCAPVVAITLRATPDHITYDRQQVTVVWSGVSSPTAQDWIGVFSPATEAISFNCTTRTPVKLKMCSAWARGHLVNGTGSMIFALLNMRHDYVFGFFRSGVELAQTPYYGGPYVAAAAISNVVTLSAKLADTPSGVHLALTGVPGEMSVMWTTRTLGVPVAEFDLTPTAAAMMTSPLRFSVSADSATYSATDLAPGGCAVPFGLLCLIGV